MQAQRARVVVLLATFNGEKYLGEFLDSLTHQTRADFDVLIRDDGSTDATASIVEAYASRLSLSRIHADQRLGAARSFLTLLDAAGGDYGAYLFADQDDIWLPTKIEAACAALEAHPSNPCLYCTAMELVDGELKHLRFSSAPAHVGLGNALVQNLSAGCTMAVNPAGRQLVLQAVPDRMIMHDWWMYLVFSALGTVVYDRKPHIRYRLHSSNAIGAARGFWTNLGRKLWRLVSGKAGRQLKPSEQAREFLRCYGGRLSGEQIRMLQVYIGAKTSLADRLRLIAEPSVRRQTLLDNCILALLVARGRH